MGKHFINKFIIEKIYGDFKNGASLENILEKYAENINCTNYVLVSYYEEYSKIGLIDIKCLIEKNLCENLLKRTGKLYLYIDNHNISINSDDLEFNTNPDFINDFFNNQGYGNEYFKHAIIVFINIKHEDDNFSDSEEEFENEFLLSDDDDINRISETSSLNEISSNMISDIENDIENEPIEFIENVIESDNSSGIYHNSILDY